MGEVVFIEPWSDEVCQDWWDMRIQKSRAMGLSTSELQVYLAPVMPEAVLNYLFQNTIEILKNAFETDPTKALGELARAGAVEVTNVDINIED